MIEQDKNQGLISEVPGFEGAADVVPTQPGQVVALPDGAFRGDPSRVLGHPANEASGMQLAEALRKQNDATHVGETALEQSAGSLIEVPDSIRHPQ